MPRIKSTQQWHRDLWDVFSQFIRFRDKGICFTCGKRNYDEVTGEWTIKGMNAGHFKHGVLDFDEMNINCQCVTCNKWWSGRLDVYAERLIKKYGLGEFNKLIKRAAKAQGGEIHSVEWYQEKIKYYKNRMLTLTSSE